MISACVKRFQEFVDKYNFLSNLPNVSLNFGAIESPDQHPLEQVYLHHIFKYLQTWADFSDFQFYIIGSNAPWDFEFDKRSVVFYMSNEDHRIPEKLDAALAVFSPYCPLAKDRKKHHFAIPLGYNGSLIDLPIRPILEREQTVFFSGNLHRRRLPFYLSVQAYLAGQKLLGRKDARQHIQFNNTFGGGMQAGSYAQMLMNSQIALVPEGYLSNISFRFFEAAKYGTLIITKGLYDYWFFKHFPGIELRSWIDVGKSVRNLLNRPKQMQGMQAAILNYYQRYCSEKATATYIIQQLEKVVKHNA